MSEQNARPSPAGTLPPPSANGSTRPPPAAAQVRLSLAVALLPAGIAGGLLMAAAGTARITQLRRVIRRGRYLGQTQTGETTDARRP